MTSFELYLLIISVVLFVIICVLFFQNAIKKRIIIECTSILDDYAELLAHTQKDLLMARLELARQEHKHKKNKTKDKGDDNVEIGKDSPQPETKKEG